MRKPPSAGPARRRATGRMNWSSELACGSSEAGRTSGTIASNAGPKNAVPAPKTATSRSMCQSSSAPVSDEDGDHPDREPSRHVRGEHQAAAVEAVAHDAAHQQEGERRHGHGDADHRERRRRVRERIDLPRQRHDEDAVSQQRDAHPAPQQPEVPQAQWREEANPAEAAAAVEPFVVMVHRPGWAAVAPHRRCAGTPAWRRRPWAERTGSPDPSRTRAHAIRATARGTRSPRPRLRAAASPPAR